MQVLVHVFGCVMFFASGLVVPLNAMGQLDAPGSSPFDLEEYIESFDYRETALG